MLKRWLIYFLTLTFAFIFYSIYIKYLSYFILIAVLATPVFSLLISLPSLLFTKISTLPLPGMLEQNEEISIKLFVKKPVLLSYTPLRIYYYDRNITLGSERKRKTFFFSSPSEDGTVTIPLHTDNIGKIEFKITHATAFDYLGLFKFSLKVPESREFVILPAAVAPSPMPKLPDGDVSGKLVKPKAGGGFSEDHELREYRQGDPMNSVHWKLSSKHDELVVREPLIFDKGIITVAFDAFGTPEELSSSIGQLIYLARYFNGRMIDFYICYYNSHSTLVNVKITDKTDFLAFIVGLLGEELKPVASVSDLIIAKADWFYTITAQQRTQEAAV